MLIDVKEPTEYILVHANKLAVTSLDVHQSSGGEYIGTVSYALS